MLDGLISKEHQNNRFIGYVNVNSSRSNIDDRKEYDRKEKSEYTYYSLTKTKLDESFPDAQF